MSDDQSMDQSHVNEEFIKRALQRRLLTRSQTDSLRRELVRRSQRGQQAPIESVAVEVGYLDVASAQAIVGEMTPPPQRPDDFAQWSDPQAKAKQISEETGVPMGTPPPPAEALEMELPPPLSRSGDSVFEDSEAISELAKGDPTESTKTALTVHHGTEIIDEEPDMERGFTMPPVAPAPVPKAKKQTDLQTRQVQPPPTQRRPSEIVEEEPAFDRGFTMPPAAPQTGRAEKPPDATTNRVTREAPKRPTELVDHEPEGDGGFTLGPPLADDDSETHKINDKSKETTGGGRSTTARTTADGKAKEGTNRQSFDTDDIDKAGAVIDSAEMTIAQLRTKMQLGTGVDVGGSNKGATAVSQLSRQTQTGRKRYVVIREIARGGMGKVLEVEDTDLRRSVALKVLRKELVNRRDLVERFLEEAQITGQLEHPNIVPVHEIGIDGKGNLYFTMKLVEGLGLNEILNRLRAGDKDMLREYSVARLLEMFLKLCEGIAFAHSRGVIHRDLKPANIMVGRFGEVQIMDWGVAKIVQRSGIDAHEKAVISDRMESSFGATMIGAIVGTPSYMAPEQAKGETDSLGVESDIFALGVILYELMCLRSPWTGKTSDEVLEQVRTFDPEPPSRRNLDRAIPPELDDLALRCLHKDREKRLGSVRELMVNVRNHMEGRTMAAVKYSFNQLLAKWVSRNKRSVLTLLLVVVAVVGGAAATLFFLKQQELDRIPGMLAEAREHYAQGVSAEKAGKFTEAKNSFINARTGFEQVLKVDAENEEARKQSEFITAELDRALVKEHDFTQQQEDAEKFKTRLAEAKNLLKEAKVESRTAAKYRKLLDSLRILDILLDSDPKNDDALAAKADCALAYSRRALSIKNIDEAVNMYEIGRATGLRKNDFDKLDADIATAKAGGDVPKDE